MVRDWSICFRGLGSLTSAFAKSASMVSSSKVSIKLSVFRSSKFWLVMYSAGDIKESFTGMDYLGFIVQKVKSQKKSFKCQFE